jgi:uncharacterized SAM-binding protein YcdF (DUF218 family)
MLRSLAVRWLGRPLEVDGGLAVADAVVVLGAPLRRDGSLSDVLEERVAAGVELWRRGVAPLIVMTGGHGPGVAAMTTEAEAMAARARQLGVPAGSLLLEVESENTSRNAELTARLLLVRGARRVVIVSQPFHLRRAVLWFRRCGLDATGYVIANSLQVTQPARGLRWIGREYASLLRDLLVTRRPGGPSRSG